VRAVAPLARVAARYPAVRRVLRALSRPIRRGPRRILSGPAAGMRIDLAGSRPSYLLGSAEPELQAFLERHLRRGSVFYDVGANVGYFSIVGAALVGPGGQVVAFEPSAANVAALRRNAELNGLDHVRVVEAAVGGAAGHARFDPGPSDQQGRLTDDGQVQVDVVTVDDVVAGGTPPPDVVKIDVEGAELACLTGALKTLRDHRPTIVCEVHDVSPSLDEHPVPRLLRDLGYELSWLESDPNNDVWAPHVAAVPSASASG
jgi:FkbM family methyltransferase